MTNICYLIQYIWVIFMNKKQIAIYEKRGYDNASFATGYSKERADACVKKIYETYRKKLIEDGYYGYGENFSAPEIEADEKINYIALPRQALSEGVFF